VSVKHRVGSDHPPETAIRRAPKALLFEVPACLDWAHHHAQAIRKAYAAAADDAVRAKYA
jgi:hypothetical protein